MKILGWGLLALALAIAGGYYPLVRHSPSPRSEFPLDLDRVRALAGAVPGPRPTEVRFEEVMALQFYEAMLLAGDGWRATPMPVYSYQVVYPERTVLVDTALDRSLAKPEGMVLRFDEAAHARVAAALDRAAQIVVTHEHMDHIGGIANHPRLARILPAVRLTTAQFANRDGMKPAQLPEEAVRGYEPLAYDGLHALAPGVVLIAAPGHTPGSQMVFVQRADGRELLLLGDVTWRRRNIDLIRERPLFMTLLIGEDRQQVLGQFQALHRLAQREPGLALVPGHDGPALETIAAAGYLQPGFR